MDIKAARPDVNYVTAIEVHLLSLCMHLHGSVCDHRVRHAGILEFVMEKYEKHIMRESKEKGIACVRLLKLR